MAASPFADEVAFLETAGRAGKGYKTGFLGDMLRAAHQGRGWSPKQLEAIHRCMQRDAEAAQAPAVSVAAPEDMADVVALFAKASAKLARPALLIQPPGAPLLRLSMAGAMAKVPGSINVAEVGGEWFGRVLADGQWRPSLRCTTPPGVLAAVRTFARNPAVAAAEFGRATGRCCFCGRGLTDEGSTAVGYGPICAEKWGLPWGKDAGSAAFGQAA